MVAQCNSVDPQNLKEGGQDQGQSHARRRLGKSLLALRMPRNEWPQETKINQQNKALDFSIRASERCLSHCLPHCEVIHL